MWSFADERKSRTLPNNDDYCMFSIRGPMDWRAVQKLVEENQPAVLARFAFQCFYLWLQVLNLWSGQRGMISWRSLPTYCLEIVENSIAVAIPLQLSLSLIPPLLSSWWLRIFADILNKFWIDVPHHSNARVFKDLWDIHLFFAPPFVRSLRCLCSRETCLWQCATVVGHFDAFQVWHVTATRGGQHGNRATCKSVFVEPSRSQPGLLREVATKSISLDS